MDEDNQEDSQENVQVDKQASIQPARLIAFYLPQYHPTPENDQWWGKGFTEWSNVTRAKPLFPGHYQPHLPGELGFYDLRLPSVRQAQADLARQYGIYGFCYYHYWFEGRRLLHQPLDDMLSSGQPDFPFCLSWANENWTRRWDGEDQEGLMEQRYSPEDDLTHIRWLLSVCADPRYIRIEGKPLLLIYSVKELPDPARTAAIWREEAARQGLPGLYLCKMESRSGNRGDPALIGFDGSIEFPPHEFPAGPPQPVSSPDGRAEQQFIYDYANLVHASLEREIPDYKCFPGVLTGFDNTARRSTGAYILRDSSPALFKLWLKHACERASQLAPAENLVFINAWNEWAEGAHLEPDTKFGRGYLEATRQVVENRVSLAEDFWPLYQEYISLQRDHTHLTANRDYLQSYSEQLQDQQARIVQHGQYWEEQFRELERYVKHVEQDRGQLVEKYNWMVGAYESLTQRNADLEQQLNALLQTRTVQTARRLGVVSQQLQRSALVTAHTLGQPVLRKLQGPIESLLDQPSSGGKVAGKLTVSGWAISSRGPISQVEIWLGQSWLGLAEYGAERPDVLASRPWQTLLSCGFKQTFDLSWEYVGEQTLRLVIRDAQGNSQELTQQVIIAATPLIPQTVPEEIFATPTTRPDQTVLYRHWIHRQEPTSQELRDQRELSRTLAYRPLISILTPVYNTPPELLRATISSVLAQSYENWELWLVDGASNRPETRATLAEFKNRDYRLHIQLLDHNSGIAGNTNAALKMAQGEFVALLDHDDTLRPFALYEVVSLLNRQPDTDMIYSDEDKLSETGERIDPFFKPDWSPDLFRSVMYTCHLGVYRTQLVRELGGFRVRFDGAQDYDLVLRLMEQTERIRHIPKILYHWRITPGSTAHSLQAKDYARRAQIRAMSEHCRRLGLKAVVGPGLTSNLLRVRRLLDKSPRVSIIIPTRDQLPVLKQCVESIQERSSYPNYEILIIDNQSRQPEILAYFEELSGQPGLRVINYPHQFNFSAINNFAAQQAEGEVLLFLNNDTEVITPDWLEAMVEHVLRPEVGAVGARLLYPNDTLQHGGVLLGVGGVAGHASKALPAEAPGYFSRAKAIQNFSAVTAACLMVRREVFLEMGGFEEVNLKIAFNDVDFCLRLREIGLLIVWTPYAELYHHESLSRGSEDSPEKVARFQHEIKYMQERWGDLLFHDPYYNPNLTLVYEDFSIEPNQPAQIRPYRPNLA